jgi:hypothetical protein
MTRWPPFISSFLNCVACSGMSCHSCQWTRMPSNLNYLPSLPTGFRSQTCWLSSVGLRAVEQWDVLPFQRAAIYCIIPSCSWEHVIDVTINMVSPFVGLRTHAMTGDWHRWRSSDQNIQVASFAHITIIPCQAWAKSTRTNLCVSAPPSPPSQLTLNGILAIITNGLNTKLKWKDMGCWKIKG